MSKLNDSQVSREIMIAAWAIALGAIAPMLDLTMINIAIKQTLTTHLIQQLKSLSGG